jgi:spore coat protein JB
MNKSNQMQPMNQRELYEWIMMLGFCALDMTLYLDTHPDDMDALDYWNQCNELYRSAMESYEERYGLLTLGGGQPLESWDWNIAPMPWEGGR